MIAAAIYTKGESGEYNHVIDFFFLPFFLLVKEPPPQHNFHFETAVCLIRHKMRKSVYTILTLFMRKS